MADESYTEYVTSQSRSIPRLQNLCHFLRDDVNKNSCRIVCLEFSSLNEAPYTRALHIEDVKALLNELGSGKNATSDVSMPEGRILIVEDLCKELKF